MSLRARLAKLEASRPERGGLVLDLARISETTLAAMADAYGATLGDAERFRDELAVRIGIAQADGTYPDSLRNVDLHAILSAFDAAKGARGKAAQVAQAMLDGEAEQITRTAIAAALAGDTVALRLGLARDQRDHDLQNA